MKKRGIFLLLSASFVLHSMDRAVISESAEGSHSLPIVAPEVHVTTECAEGARLLSTLPADVLEAQKKEMREKLHSIREGFLHNTLGYTELGVICRSDSEAVALVIAEELFAETLFAQDVIKWVEAYLMKRYPTEQEKNMAAKLRVLLHYALQGSDKFDVPLKLIDELRNASQQLWFRKFEEVERDPRRAHPFELYVDYHQFDHLLEKK